jgi:dihydroorotase
VADRYGVIDRGYLREGYWADLVLVAGDSPTPVTRQRVLSQCGWSPFEGEVFRSSILATLVNGQVVYRDGAIIERNAAQSLQFRPQR